MLFSSLASLLLVAQRDFYGGERYVVASHAGVFTGARFSSLPEKRASLKTPAWEARYVAALVGRKNIRPTLILQDSDNFNTTAFSISTEYELSILSNCTGRNVLSICNTLLILNFAIWARQYLQGFYFCDLNRKI